MEQCEDDRNTTTELIEENSSCERVGFKEKLRHPVYRRKFISTIWIASAFFIMGWITGQRGPCLPDFLLITNTELEKGSAYFTSGSVGYAIGSLSGGIVLDRYNRSLILFMSFVLCAVVLAVTPWCTAFLTMLTCHFLTGITNGIAETGGTAECTRIWGKEAGPYLQFTIFAFSFGSMIAPLVIQPFLAPIIQSNISFTSTVYGNISFANETAVFGNESNVTGKHSDLYQPQSRIFIGFSITSALSILAAMPFLVEYCRSPSSIKTRDINGDRPVKRNFYLPRSVKQISLVLLGFLLCFYTIVEEIAGTFLVTFTLNKLGWTKAKGSDITSVLFACITVGRFSGIFVSHFIRSSKLVIICLICMLLSFIGLYFGVVSGIEIAIWVFVGFSGFSMSYVYSAIFTWTEEDIVNVTAKISGYFILMSSLGNSISPVVTGFLMQEYDTMYFIYVLIATTVTALALYVVLFVFVKFKIQSTRNNDLAKQVDQPEVLDANTHIE